MDADKFGAVGRYVSEKGRLSGYGKDTGYAEKLVDGEFVDDVVVFDQNIVTSQGPATPYPFSFKILPSFKMSR